MPPRLRNLGGTFLLVGVPWLTFVVVYTAPGIGLWGLYEFGNDFWMYQRYGYRIVMQGYWLEGGSPIFYFQPLYRWISGLLHAVFGEPFRARLWPAGALIAAGIWLHMAEFHEHRHVHEALAHSHAHVHDDLHHVHTHAVRVA